VFEIDTKTVLLVQWSEQGLYGLWTEVFSWLYQNVDHRLSAHDKPQKSDIESEFEVFVED
jgi:hypothetical protein